MDGTLFRIDNSIKFQIPDADIPERQRKVGEVMFADMISMGDMTQTKDFQVDTMDEAVGSIQSESVETRRENPADAYEKYQYKDKTIRAESKAVSEQDVEKVETEVTEFTEKVTEVLEEELHVSKEEIEAAMEELGLTFMDLLDAGNLANLVSKLSDNEDANQLLCSETFTNILQQVNALGKEMFAELQMTPEEVKIIQQELEKMTVEAEMVVEQPKADSTVNPDKQENVVEATQNVSKAENPVNSDESTKVVEIADEVADEVVVAKEFDTLEEVTETSEEVVTDKVVVESVTAEPSKEDGFSEQMDNSEEQVSDEKTGKSENSGVKVTNTADPKAESHVFSVDASANSLNNQSVIPENVQSIPSYISVADIMEQLVEQTRVHITQDTTKMEMLLNPEHLGKLYLEITKQEGAVTAKIQTQNAIVKEALEMQIADLRQNLTQVGVKVDAIEVTIASHEFERNLEQDANSQKQQEDTQPKLTRMRNINMNELDGLSGLMSDEEAIVAKMMAEQGNSINFTA